ncbi:MAG: hypothetical protein HFJ17_00775 [Clostridia bacterium]|nr:hypothetical protein [Clostridia bacterium]
MEKEFIDITPHKSIMCKISQTGYSIQEAISELIDNSIDARKKNVVISIEISQDEIKVEDTGIGMNKKQAQNAIRLGYSSKKGKLGEFGLGLKTATSFLGEEMTLITKQEDSDEEYKIIYKEKDWLKNGEWFKYPFYINKDNSNRHGTIVIINKIKLEITSQLIEKIKEELGRRFAPFILNNEAKIYFNGEECKVPTPDIIPNTKKEIDLKIDDCTIKGWWAYQLVGYNKSYYGFNTFRRGRLVTVFDKIGISPNENIKQIVGELEINGVPITHDKKNWVKASEEFIKVENILKEYFKEYEYTPKRILSGYPASKGIVVGTVRQVNMFSHGNMEEGIKKVNKGDIIVTAMTRPQFLIAIRRAGGIITDLGGTLCHAAIVSREFGIPAVVGTNIATKVLVDGQKVIIDGEDGSVYEY